MRRRGGPPPPWQLFKVLFASMAAQHCLEPAGGDEISEKFPAIVVTFEVRLSDIRP